MWICHPQADLRMGIASNSRHCAQNSFMQFHSFGPSRRWRAAGKSLANKRKGHGQPGYYRSGKAHESRWRRGQEHAAARPRLTMTDVDAAF